MGGVMMFFDRAMFVEPIPHRGHADVLLGWPWETYALNPQHQRPRAAVLTLRSDSLPNRPDPYNRHHKDRSLLRTQAKMEGHTRLCRWNKSDPHALGLHWLHH